MSTYALTQGDFTLFVKHSQKFLKLLGLSDWNVQFAFDDLSEDETLAHCEHSTRTAQMATLVLSKKWGFPATPEEIKRVALHEVSHILLASIYNAAIHLDLSEFQKRQAIDREIHVVIRRLEKVFAPSESAFEAIPKEGE